MLLYSGDFKFNFLGGMIEKLLSPPGNLGSPVAPSFLLWWIGVGLDPEFVFFSKI